MNAPQHPSPSAPLHLSTTAPPLKILHVVGARPNFMKIAPIMEEIAKYPDRFEQVLVHTGQHGNGTLLGRGDVPGLL